MRIGVVDQAAPGWTAGGVYSSMLLSLLEQAADPERMEIFLLSTDGPKSSSAPPKVRQVVIKNATPLPGESIVRQVLGKPPRTQRLKGEARLRHLLRLRDPSDVAGAAEHAGISVILPLLDVPEWRTRVKMIGWVPDLQHIYMPQLFSAEERANRDASINRLLRRSAKVLVSSKAAMRDLVRFKGDGAHRIKVFSFPSLFGLRPPQGDPISSRKLFCMPDRFVLVANQFWRHKNHLAVIEAVRLLADEGIRVPVIMTGLPVDHRDSQNTVLSEILQRIASADLAGQVVVLGHVSRTNLEGLLRAATLVIQPSLFEGWNTTVQDAKALGRPIVCSDIAVHHEQVPDALGFFPAEDPASLAEILRRHWEDLPPGPDPQTEELALRREREFARRQAELLIDVCADGA